MACPRTRVSFGGFDPDESTAAASCLPLTNSTSSAPPPPISAVNALKVGQRFQWKAGEVHGYGNPSGHTASLLCIDQPTFIPEDETLVVDEVS